MKRRKRLSAGGIALISLASVLLIAICLGTAYVFTVASTEEIFPNVYAAGVNLGGMTEEEASDALKKYVAETYGSETLELRLPNAVLKLTPEIVGAKMNTMEVAAGAHAFGRNGNAFRRFSIFKRAENADVAFTVTAGISVDEASIRDAVQAFAEGVYVEMQPCKWYVDEENSEIVVKIGTTGLSLSTDEVTALAVNAVLNNNFSPISVDYNRTLFPEVDLSDIYAQVHMAVADAYYDSSVHEIIGERIGYGFDLAAASQKILLAGDRETLVIKMEPIYPNVTRAQLEQVYFADLVGEYSTSGLGNSNRQTNIKLACQALDGVVLEPGDIFSYNQTLGQRTSEKGYKEAGAYVQGKSVQEIGGGICQVSTTLYNAVLLANLEIVARSEHIYAASYVPLGMDATVSWGGPDFQFRNSTSYPMRIHAWVDNGKIFVELYGTSTGVTVKMRHDTLATIPYTTVTTKDPEEVCSSGRTGYNVVTYRDVYDASGNMISSGVEAYSYYSKCDIVVLESDVNRKARENENNP